MLEKDRKAISAIFAPLYIVRPELAESPALIFEISTSVYAVNVLGIVAGTLSLETNSFALGIDMVSDEILGFKVINCKQKEQDNLGKADDKND
jgi:hypothetical protein